MGTWASILESPLLLGCSTPPHTHHCPIGAAGISSVCCRKGFLCFLCREAAASTELPGCWVSAESFPSCIHSCLHLSRVQLLCEQDWDGIIHLSSLPRLAVLQHNVAAENASHCLGWGNFSPWQQCTHAHQVWYNEVKARLSCADQHTCNLPLLLRGSSTWGNLCLSPHLLLTKHCASARALHQQLQYLQILSCNFSLTPVLCSEMAAQKHTQLVFSLLLLQGRHLFNEALMDLSCQMESSRWFCGFSAAACFSSCGSLAHASHGNPC